MSNLDDEKERNTYYHKLAEDSRSLELLLHTSYKIGLKPIIASKGHSKNKVAYIILSFDKKHINTIGRLMDLTLEIPECEFNIRSHNNELYVELSCEEVDNDQLFTRIKEIVEEDTLDKETHNLTIMNTIYNISNIISNIIEADIIFATNEDLYNQGKCAISIYKGKIPNTKKNDNLLEVIQNLKEKEMLNLPTCFFCSFEELRNFYFELDEVVYGDDNNGQ